MDTVEKGEQQTSKSDKGLKEKRPKGNDLKEKRLKKKKKAEKVGLDENRVRGKADRFDTRFQIEMTLMYFLCSMIHDSYQLRYDRQHCRLSKSKLHSDDETSMMLV